nr:ATP synthase F0 subunit 8 [Ixodes ovatus]UZN43741.1 ATP synthase F0 subunit 8 [Ixodes ovatus]
MPQLFPMNWMFMSLMFSLILILYLINIYYLPLNSKKFYNLKKSNNKLFLKW